MPYALRADRAQQLVWDSLPEPVALRLGDALWQACEDPHGATVPYGEDDGVVRMLVRPEFTVVLLVSDATRRVKILQITYLG